MNYIFDDILDKIQPALDLETITKLISLKSPMDFTEEYVSEEDIEALLEQYECLGRPQISLSERIVQSLELIQPSPVDTDYI